MAITDTQTALLGETARRPDAVVVHDPVPSGALSLLHAEPDADTVRERYLFRARPDEQEFALQHAAFVAAIEQAGIVVHHLGDLVAGDPEVEPGLGNPNQVYTRDALVTLPWLPGAYIAGRMHAPIRQTERVAMEAAMARLGLTAVADVPDGLVLEGGDVIPLIRGGRRSLLIGYGRRTHRETLDFLADALIPRHVDEIVGVLLAPWRINLDGGMVPVADDVVIAHPESLLDGVLIDAEGTTRVDVLDLLRDIGMTVIEVTRDESVINQACNCLCLGDRRVVCYDLTPRLPPLLRATGVSPICVAGSELVKGTGGPRCMSRPIYW
jgi:N-dimethylarginine dimethylaminohydrolase